MSDTATLAVHVTGAALECGACGTTVDIYGGDWRTRANTLVCQPPDAAGRRRAHVRRDLAPS